MQNSSVNLLRHKIRYEIMTTSEVCTKCEDVVVGEDRSETLSHS